MTKGFEMIKNSVKKVILAKKNEKGASAVEYALIVGLIAIVIIAATTNLGTAIAGKFDAIKTELTR